MNDKTKEPEGLDASEAPFMEHLVELRRRLLWCVLGLLISFAVAVFFAKEIFDFLAAPLHELLRQQPNGRLIYTQLYEQFFTEIKVGFWTAFFVSFPWFAIQVWKFVAPGLYKHEKKAFLPFLIATPVLFFLGGALVYYFIFPLAWEFFLSFQTQGDENTVPTEVLPRVADYLSLVMRLIFAFGLAFQLPVVLTLLARAGIVSSQGLARQRKYAIVLVFVAAAILTPPDVISQIGLAVPILLLYEISILLARMGEKKRAQKEAALEREIFGTGQGGNRG